MVTDEWRNKPVAERLAHSLVKVRLPFPLRRLDVFILDVFFIHVGYDPEKFLGQSIPKWCSDFFQSCFTIRQTSEFYAVCFTHEYNMFISR